MLLNEPPHFAVNRNHPFKREQVPNPEDKGVDPELDPANDLQLRLLQYRLAFAKPTRS